MDSPTPAFTPTPPVSGVSPVQSAPTEVVIEIPEDLKNANGLAQFPVTSVIDTLRRDTGGIRGDASLLMLQSMVQGLERQSMLADTRAAEASVKVTSLESENKRLAIENAELKKDVAHKDSDKDLRTAIVAVGGLGFGVAAPIAIVTPTPASILTAAAFVAVFACGVFFSKKAGK
jgi:hypothetical protein